MSHAKTAAERQAEHKARQLSAGLVHWKRWVHPDDVPALAEYADKLAKRRERAERAVMKAHKLRAPRAPSTQEHQ